MLFAGAAFTTLASALYARTCSKHSATVYRPYCSPEHLAIEEGFFTQPLGGEAQKANGNASECMRRYAVQFSFSHQRNEFNERRMPQGYAVVCLFHGSFQTMYNSSLFIQYADNDARSWQELAKKENLILVFMESKFVANSHENGYWTPGSEDLDYVNRVLDEVVQRYHADPSRIFAVGHSNGGLFMSDVALHCKRFKAVCNHMGGLQAAIEGEQRLIDRLDVRNDRFVPFLIVSSSAEDNYAPCIRAKKEFEQRGWPVVLYLLPYTFRHGYYRKSTELIWLFFSTCEARFPFEANAMQHEQIEEFRITDWQAFIDSKVSYAQ
jgi:dienelactone hydrolase